MINFILKLMGRYSLPKTRVMVVIKNGKTFYTPQCKYPAGDVLFGGERSGWREVGYPYQPIGVDYYTKTWAEKSIENLLDSYAHLITMRVAEDNKKVSYYWYPED